MAEVNVYVWWSFGGGDGDGYDDTVELKDEDYLKLVKYFVDNDEIPSSEEIEDKKVRKIVKKIEDEALDGLEENSEDGYRGNEEEDDEGNEVDFDDWYENIDKGVVISLGDYDYEEGEYRFRISISNGRESYIDFEISKLEHFLISKADEEGENYGDVKGLEDFYERIVEAAREELEEDLDLTGDDSAVLDDLTFTISFDEWTARSVRFSASGTYKKVLQKV